VRPGSYSGVMITKAITVLGGAGVSLHVGTGFFEVANIGAGRQAAILVAGVGVQGPVQHLLFSVPVPNIPALLATVVTQQAVSATFAGGFKLSNPASYAHD